MVESAKKITNATNPRKTWNKIWYQIMEQKTPAHVFWHSGLGRFEKPNGVSLKHRVGLGIGTPRLVLAKQNGVEIRVIDL